MKFLGFTIERRSARTTYDQIADLIDGKSGAGSLADVHVSERTAIQVATVFACVRVIADGCATPDLHVYRETATRKTEKAIDRPEYRLLSRRPNEWQTSFEWRRMMTFIAALYGKSLSIKVLDDQRRVRELIPVEHGRWHEYRPSRYEIRYRCYDEFGQIGDFSSDEVFVLNGVQDSWVGSLKPVQIARSAIGLAISTERSQSAMHKNGLRPSGAYSVEGNLTDEQYKRLTRHLADISGPDKAGLPMILDRAAKWVNASMSGVDAQHIETRRHQVEEVCRVFNVFPIMIGHADKTATFASSEAFFAAHLKHTLSPWHKAWRDRMDETLLDGLGPLSTKFDTRYLTAGSMKDYAQWARTMVETGIYSRNEMREDNNLDPRGPEYDKLLTPMNMGKGQIDDNTDNPPTP